MLTSEEVSKIERDFADGDTGWMGDRASLRALLKDRAELQAEIERLRAALLQIVGLPDTHARSLEIAVDALAALEADHD